MVQPPDGLTFECCEVEPVFWKSTNPIRQILKDRSERANLPYYHPHSFRHAAIVLSLRRCRNAEEIKAVSQNFGHENIGTTLLTYGKLDNYRVNEIIDKVDFSAIGGMNDREKVKDFLRELERLIDNP